MIVVFTTLAGAERRLEVVAREAVEPGGQGDVRRGRVLPLQRREPADRLGRGEPLPLEQHLARRERGGQLRAGQRLHRLSPASCLDALRRAADIDLEPSSYLQLDAPVDIERVKSADEPMRKHGREGREAVFDEQQATPTEPEREAQPDHDIGIAVAALDVLEDDDCKLAMAEAEDDIRPQLAGVITVVGANHVKSVLAPLRAARHR